MIEVRTIRSKKELRKLKKERKKHDKKYKNDWYFCKYYIK